MEVSDEILKEIAGELSLGMKCYLNKETLEVISFPDEDRFGEFDIDDWKEDIDQVKNHPHNFIEIEPRNSSESYRSMEWFIEDVKDEAAKRKLTQAITGKKPFANFQIVVHEFPGLADEWYAFKEACEIDFIKRQLS